MGSNIPGGAADYSVLWGDIPCLVKKSETNNIISNMYWSHSRCFVLYNHGDTSHHVRVRCCLQVVHCMKQNFHAAVSYLKQVRVNQFNRSFTEVSKFVDFSSSHVLLTGRIISICVVSSGSNVYPSEQEERDRCINAYWYAGGSINPLRRKINKSIN